MHKSKYHSVAYLESTKSSRDGVANLIKQARQTSIQEDSSILRPDTLTSDLT